MPLETPPPSEAEIDRMLRSAMMRIAIRDEEGLSARTVISLQDSGLLQNVKPTAMSDQIVAGIADPTSSARHPVSSGPLLFITDSAASRTVIDMSEQLLSMNLTLRVAALAHFQGLSADDGITVFTRHALARTAAKISSEDSGNWKSAALQCFDAVQSDYLCALAGLRQSLEMDFREGTERFLTHVLRPTMRSLQTLNPILADAVVQHDEIALAVTALVNSQRDLVETFREYMRAFGHLPLGGTMSLSHVLGDDSRHWSDLKASWDSLWQWAVESADPLCIYHLCQLYSAKPELIPEKSVERLWDEIAEIVDITSPAKSAELREPWLIRSDLARHFYCYLSCHMPGQDGDRLAGVSWWFARRVANEFGGNPKYLQEMREKVFSREVEISTEMWQLVHPPIKPSCFGYATAFTRSVWSLALQCQLEPLLKQSGIEVIATPSVARIQTALNATALGGLPFGSPKSDRESYAFDRTLVPAATNWLSRLGLGESKDLLGALLQVRETHLGIDNWIESIVNTVDKTPTEQLVLAGAFRVWAYHFEGDADTLMETVGLPENGKQVFLKLEIKALELVLDGLNELRTRAAGKWSHYMPQLLAFHSENSEMDEQRRALILSHVVLSAASSGAVGALNRIIHSKECHFDSRLRSRWKGMLSAIQVIIPAWAVGRFGAVLAALRDSAHSLPQATELEHQ